MAKGFVSVEVGDRLVKVCVSNGTEKSRKVKEGFLFEVPEDMVEDGLILDAVRFSSALTREFENHKCPFKDVVFTISSSRVLTREVQMSVSTDPKIKAVIDTNKGKYFPVDLEGYTLLYRIMSKAGKGKDKGCNVLVMAMPNEYAKACYDVTDAAGFKLKGVDVSCNSMLGSLALLKQSQGTCFVNIEGGTTNICFMKGKELLMQRSLPVGGDELLREYMFKSGSSTTYLEAVDDLCGINAEDCIHGKLDDDDIVAHLDQCVGGISRTVDFFNNNKGGGITQIVLMGSCGGMLAVDELLEQNTGIQTVQMIQLPTATSLRSISQTPAYYMSTMYAGASAINFGADFDPKKQKGKRKAGKQEVDMPTVILISMLMVVFAVYWGYSAVLEHGEMETTLAKLDAEILSLDYVDDVTATHAEYEKSKDSLINFTKLTENPNEDLILFLTELEAKLPSETLVLSAVCTKTSVSLNFVTNSLVEAATVISKMRSFESIGVMNVSGLSMSQVSFEGDQYSQEMQDGFEEVTFSIVCTYGQNPYTSYINPYSSALGIPAVPNIPVVETVTPEGGTEESGTGEGESTPSEGETGET